MDGQHSADQERPAILLVDDDPSIRESVGALLELLGYRPALASSGEEALALLDGPLDPILVLLDMDMPGLGGQGTLPRLRALRPALPVLIITGLVTDSVLDLARRFPAVGLLPKPFGFNDLKQAIRRGTDPVVPGREAPPGSALLGLWPVAHLT